MDFGKRIAELRKLKKATQAQLAEYLTVNPQTVSRWEAEGGTPDVMLLPKIASFFEVSLDELFGMTDMEYINNLVYKYSVLRDEKSFEEVMRSIDVALNSKDADRLQLQTWKVHIYIQKSRAAMEKAEVELDDLLENVPKDHELYLPLKLQKQQFRIYMGESAFVVKKAQKEWEEEKNIEALNCYMAALYDAQRSIDILALWEQKDVKDLVCDINEKNECLWLMMFESAYMETNLESFIKYMSTFKEKASVNAVFQMEWMLARLYSIFDMKNKKSELKNKLLKDIENLEYNDFLKERKKKEIQEL